jgi:PncC family amidohydrolase
MPGSAGWLDEGPHDGLESLARQVGRSFTRAGLTLGVAESCTGGLILKLLTDQPGSSRFLVGGVVAYADHVKRKILAVDSQVLAHHGAVSGEVAREMSRGVRTLLDADIGLAVTGIAGPGGAVPGKPVGTVWFGISRESVRSSHRMFGGDRKEVRFRAAEFALGLLLEELSEGGEGTSEG